MVVELLPEQSRSVTHDRAAVLGDHYVDTVVAAGKLVGQNLATEDPFAPTVKTWLDARTAGGNASGDFIATAVARIFDAPADFNRWWCAANRSWFAAGVGFVMEQTGVSGGRSCHRKNRGHGASGDKMAETCHGKHLSLGW